MATGKRKFYKIKGLHTIFKGSDEGTVENPKYIYNTSVNGFVADLEQAGVKNIDEHTILFITATEEDEDRYVKIIYAEQNNSNNSSDDYEYEDNSQEQTPYYLERILHKGDTLIWVRGDVYSVSSQCVSKIVFDENRNIIITNTDGTTQTISQSDSGLGFEGIFPIVVQGNEISFEGIDIDPDNNTIVEIPNDNSATEGVKNAHVEGKSNNASVDYQHVQGKYSSIDNTAIFIIGGGEDEYNRLNLFTVGFDGIAHILTDITAGEDKDNPDYKLSDIHSVVESDWIFIGY